MRRKQQQQQQQPLLDSEGRVAHAASLDYAFRSYRNFLPPRGQQQGSDEQQQRFIEGLIADCSVAYNAGMEVSRISHADGDGSYYNNKGSTFFISSSEEPRFALEALALQVFRVHVGSGLGAGYDASSSGAEWWSQVVDADETIGFHWDRDYGLEESEGLCLYPHLATVTYLSDVGAPTIVLNDVGERTSGSHPGGPVDSAVVSKPLFGKHIKFDGRLLHAAPSLATSPNPDLPVASGGGSNKRITFLVNIWLNHRPWQTRSFPASLISQFDRASLSTLRGSLGGSSSRLAVSTVPSLTLKALLRDRETSLDLHRWRFVDGGAKYLAAVPLPSGSKMSSLFAGSDCIRLKYNVKGAEAMIVVEEEEEEAARGRGGGGGGKRVRVRLT